MNTEVIVHPKRQHVGIMTANLEAMLDWYRKVLGLTVNGRVAAPADARDRSPFTAVAFASNDEMHHRISFFEGPGLTMDPSRSGKADRGASGGRVTLGSASACHRRRVRSREAVRSGCKLLNGYAQPGHHNLLTNAKGEAL
jgi:catechol 2,3-dioxygenase-like lactoylglutathione lyase family enzyme